MAKHIKTITDEEIIGLLVLGELVVKDHDHYTPKIIYRGKLLSQTKVGNSKTNGVRLRVEICRGGRKRTIMASKLVWMASFLKLVPANYEIHHSDGDKNNNSVYNLVLLQVEDHRQHHANNEDKDYEEYCGK